MQLVVEPSARMKHILACREIVKQYRADHDLFVVYVRQDGPVPYPQIARNDPNAGYFLRLFSEPYFLRTPVQRLERLAHEWFGASIPQEKLAQQRHRAMIDALRAFMRSRRQPRIGVVVGFRKDDKLYLGWSLCRVGRWPWEKGDQFDPYMGIEKAIDAALPLISHVSQYDSYFSTRAPAPPHTIRPYLPLAFKRFQKWSSPS